MDGEYRTFDQISIGDQIKFEIFIDEKSHESFSKLSGDFSPIHCDEEFASKTLFQHRIVHAFLLQSYLSQLYGMYLPGGTSICLKQESKFIKPVYVGQKLTIQARVIRKMNSTKMLEIKTEIYNQNNQRVFEGKGIVQVLFDTRNLAMFYSSKLNKKLYDSDLIESLVQGGITKGDIILVHSDISKFGKIGDIKSRGKFLESLIDSFKQVVGEDGTIIMPTFSYSFCKNEEYDPKNTFSKVGILTEYFRRQEDVVRTIHPIFSFAMWGKEKDFFSTNLSKDAFGNDSLFGKLHQKNGRLVFFGAPFESCTFIHHIEQSYNVPYRYHKNFTGCIRIKDTVYKDTYRYFVQSRKEKSIPLNLSKFQDHLIKKGLMKKVELGDGEVLIVDSRTLFHEGIKMLKKDILSFLNPCIFRDGKLDEIIE